MPRSICSTCSHLLVLEKKKGENMELIKALYNMQNESEVVMSTPNVSQLIGDASAKPWLIQTAKTLATGSVLQRTASLGLLARLWVPTTKEEQNALTHNMIRGDKTTPVEDRCIAAFDLPKNSIEEIEQMACHKCSIVEEDIEALVKTVEDHMPDAALAHSILLERDDLESIHFMLSKKDAGIALQEALEILDYSIISRLNYFDAAKPIECERLKEVSVFNPNM